MAEKIRDNLYRLDIPLVGSPLKNLNSYLITGERNLLIDTGFREEPCREAMNRQLRELGVDMNRTDIFVTHLHTDHCGLASELRRPGCRIYMTAGDAEELLDRGSDEFWRLRNEKYIEDGFARWEMDELWGTNPAKEAAPKLFRDYTVVREGDVLAYGGYRLECVSTPGHPPDHMCLYEREKKILFSGDHVLFHISPNICRWEVMPDALGSYLESLEKVKDLPVELLLPAHREETGELKARTEELIAHHHRRLEDTVTVVRSTPGMTAYEVAGAMRWQIRCRSWEDFPLIQKFFAVGEALSHLDYLLVRHRLRREQREDGRYIWFVNEE